MVSSNDVDTDDDNSLIDVEIDEDKSVINSLFSLKDEDTDCDSSVIEDEIEEDKSLINSLFSLKDDETDCDNSLIDDDNEDDKSVKSVLTWSNDEDTDCDNSFIEDETEDERVVNSLSSTKFSSNPKGPPIHLSIVVSHNNEPEIKLGFVGSFTNKPPNTSSVPFNSMILSSKVIVSDLIDVKVPKTLRPPLTVRFEPVNSNELETDPVNKLSPSRLNFTSNESATLVPPITKLSA